MNDTKQFVEDFHRRLDSPLQLNSLFDCLPESYFWAKDKQSRFVAVSRGVLKLTNCDSEAQMLGRTDLEFYPRDLAESYIEEDRWVMNNLQPVMNRAWLVPNHHGELKWYISTKIPLFGDGGRAVGTAGVMRDIEKAGAVVQPYQEMEEVVNYVLSKYTERIDVSTLAAMAHLSVSQFDCKFKRVFQITPQQFIIRVRVDAASQALVNSDQSVAIIALKSGFYDQSYFTKQFRAQTGMTPTAYRRKYREKMRRERDG
ncbi:MAG: AraC family transcriptional regulator [Pirellulales bacterium]|nr:AraC family transcriptional regulator [Pirellulales bacterium]